MNAWHETLVDFARTVIQGIPTTVSFAPSPHYAIRTGLEVYRNNYRGNLQDALAGAYPVIEQLVGADFFRMMARAFISQHVSHSANLFDYGAQLGDFLAAYEPARALAYLPDVARLEWACHRAYFASDAAPLELARLAQVAPDDYAALRLQVHPACHIVASIFPIVAIWQAHQGATDFETDWAHGGQIALVMRQHDTVEVRELIEDEAHWLAGMMQEERLGDATAATLNSFPNFNLQDSMQRFASLGILTDFALGERT